MQAANDNYSTIHAMIHNRQAFEQEVRNLIIDASFKRPFPNFIAFSVLRHYGMNDDMEAMKEAEAIYNKYSGWEGETNFTTMTMLMCNLITRRM